MSSASFGYHRRTVPPLPMLTMLVRALGGAPGVQLDAIADTGSDRTIVPARVAQAILKPSGTLRLQGVGGQPFEVASYSAAVEIAGEVDLLEVAGWGDETIAGRDLLNRWIARFDGPLLQLELSR